MRILMVCLGNICRSPLAHGVLEHKLRDTNVIVDSAGTASYHIGELPDRRSIQVAKSHGIDLSQQKARQFTPKDFDEFDRIYAMDKSNLNDLRELAQNQEDIDKLHLFLDSNPASKYREVPDPYYGGIDGFEEVFALVHETCDIIAQELHNSI